MRRYRYLIHNESNFEVDFVDFGLVAVKRRLMQFVEQQILIVMSRNRLSPFEFGIDFSETSPSALPLSVFTI